MIDLILASVCVYLGLGCFLLSIDYWTDKQDYIAIYKMNGLKKLITTSLIIIFLWPAVLVRWYINR